MSKRAAVDIGKVLLKRGLTLGLAESCTGGLLGHLLTNIPGSSKWFKGTIVAYSNDIKKRLLRVPQKVLKEHGAVSGETAAIMARSVKKALRSNIALSVTGIAGPGGGTREKPVGTVFMAVTDGKRLEIKRFSFKKAPREKIKKSSAAGALKTLDKFLAKR